MFYGGIVDTGATGGKNKTGKKTATVPLRVTE